MLAKEGSYIRHISSLIVRDIRKEELINLAKPTNSRQR